jgi:putative transferase (TIGR04331 family)
MILQLTKIKENNRKADLYLGSWCHDVIGENDKKTHKYHWSNLNKFEKDSDLIFTIYNSLLGRLSKRLNAIHNVNNDVNYWQKVVGPWLLFLVSIVFDRFENLNSLKNKRELTTHLPDYNIVDWIPLDFVDFESMAASDEWNLYIYAEIIKELNIIQYKKTRTRLINSDLYKRKNENLIKKVIKNVIYFSNRMIPERYRDICLIEPGLQFREIISINLRFKKYPFQYHIREVTRKSKINFSIRNSDTTDMIEKNDTKVVKLICGLMIKNLPIAYLESFASNRVKSLRHYPENPRFILTACAHFSNELFKVWIAEKSLISKKVHISVHGAHHSTPLFNHPGQLTEIISDIHFTWGWTNNILLSSKLSKLQNSVVQFKNVSTKVKICFVAYSANKYSGSICASPTSSNFIDSLDAHKHFFENLKIEFLSNITLRLKGTSKTWDLESFYRNLGVKQFSYLQTESLKRLLKRHNLFIFGYESTMFLETMTLNIPSLIFFEDKFWRLNQMGCQDYNELRKVNIYHESHDKLCTFINKMSMDEINEWWFDPKTQDARDNFLKKHARSDIHYLNGWTSTIQKNMD